MILNEQDLEVTECPKCGNDYEFYVGVQITGRTQAYFNFATGEEFGAVGKEDNLDYEYGEEAYCVRCNTFLGCVEG